MSQIRPLGVKGHRKGSAHIPFIRQESQTSPSNKKIASQKMIELQQKHKEQRRQQRERESKLSSEKIDKDAEAFEEAINILYEKERLIQTFSSQSEIYQILRLLGLIMCVRAQDHQNGLGVAKRDGSFRKYSSNEASFRNDKLLYNFECMQYNKIQSSVINNPTIIEMNGVLQFTLICFVAKYGQLITNQHLDTNHVFLCAVGAMALNFICLKSIFNSKTKQIAHVTYLIFFTNLNQDFKMTVFDFLCCAALCYISYMKLLEFQVRQFDEYKRVNQLTHKYGRYERIFSNMRFGYAILSYQNVHFQNDNFRKTLGIKQDSQIRRRQRIMHQNGHSKQIDMKGEKSQPPQIKTVSVMEDMINFLRNKPTVEINEEIEYQLEKIDSRINQKYLRFFIITFQFILWDGQQKIQLTVRDVTQDKKLLDQRMVCQLRNMMFKSFTHEIKTPLNGVVQTIDLSNGILNKLLDEKKNSYTSPDRTNHKKLQSYMNSIESGIYILQNNLNDLIDYQLIENGELKINFKQFRLKECYDTIIKIIKPQIQNADVKFINFLDPNIPIFMENDQDRIIRIVLNLLLNAQKFTPQGQIKFTMKGISQKRDSSTPQNNYIKNTTFVKFEVSDTGLGIPDDKKNYIFKLLESDLMALGNMHQSNHQKSAKVGLPICQLLCQKMGGQIKVNSQLGQGTKFWFIIPVNQRKANPSTFGDAVDTKTQGIEYEESDTDEEKLGANSQRFSSNDEAESNYGLPEQLAMTHQLQNENFLCLFQQNVYDEDNFYDEYKFDDEQSELGGGLQGQFGGGFQGRKSSFIPYNSKNAIVYSNNRYPRKKSQFAYLTFNQIAEHQKYPQEELKLNQDKSPGGRSRSNQKLQSSGPEFGPDNERKLKVNKSYDSLGFNKEINSNQNRFQLTNNPSPQKQSRMEGVRKLRVNSNFSILKQNRLSEGSDQDKSIGFISDDDENCRLVGDKPFIQQQVKQSKTHNEAQIGQKLNQEINPQLNHTLQPTQVDNVNIEQLFSTPCKCAQILIVDDIDMNRLMVTEILKQNFNLISDQAINGKECLKIIKAKQYSECCSSYKIIFMDYEMPIMNGIEAIQHILMKSRTAKMLEWIIFVHFNFQSHLVAKPAPLAHIAATLKEIHRHMQNRLEQSDRPPVYSQVPLETGFFLRQSD
ncbi:multi-sensor hybrid histidine kinase [Stylonychia lemnae]|uniref:Multi-sensor hybrid histidine kinase n=1 Tax=Stylonychia lemnae TaxID=5949 RepID=A0A078ADS5_STYLE|nr:multi-sensor hybrid histidine kinase [Stylonychia lemnae]|eukprot:CDW79053.1 multi-sensor hybrid histidine kinase [Stylonychia lemnae]